MAHFHNNILLGASGQAGYQVSRSLRFNSPDSANLTRSIGTTGNRTQFTWSGWFKRTGLGTDQFIFGAYYGGSLDGGIGFNSSNQLYFSLSGNTYNKITSAVFRDCSAWYHVVVAFDSPNATAANRIRIYVNGVEQTNYTTQNSGLPPQNYNSFITLSGADLAIGKLAGYTQNYFNGYLTEIHFIDGQVLTPSSFGETDTITGVWKPKRYTGTYGTNGFYLNFADNSAATSTTLGKDSSGNGNNWTPNNVSVTSGSGNDSLIDVPTAYADGSNGRGNYCTLNPTTPNHTGNLIPPTNGNLDLYLAAGSNAAFGAVGTVAITSGKFYWEVTPTAVQVGAGTWMEIGIIQAPLVYPNGNFLSDFNGGFAYLNDGYKRRSGSSTAYGATWTTNDVIGVAFDADAGSITFYKNGVSQGVAYSDLASYNIPAGYYPAIAIYRSNVTNQSASFNFGQRPFAYTPPAGFKALNTQNLPEPTIKKPSSYMDALTYTGNGSTQAISGLGFSPDLVWTKSRSNGYANAVFDVIRGATNRLETDTTSAAYTESNSLTAFNSDGFTLGGAPGTNANTATYVAWCWDESATPGFDIVTYTGDGTTSANRLIDHSLGVKPDFIITKKRSSGTTDYGWSCWHKNLGGNYGIWLERTSARNAGMWTGYSNFSSTKFTPPDLSYGNENNQTYVNYLWAEVPGFSRFGSYTGNGSSDGPFVWCGFQPKVLLIKSSSSGYDWFIFDDARNTYNTVDLALFPNASGAESGGSTYLIDFTSNGFKLRNSLLNLNGNGNTYIFAAWAEFPAKYSLAR